MNPDRENRPQPESTVHDASDTDTLSTPGLLARLRGILSDEYRQTQTLGVSAGIVFEGIVILAASRSWPWQEVQTADTGKLLAIGTIVAFHSLIPLKMIGVATNHDPFKYLHRFYR